eukprot:426757_1
MHVQHKWENITHEANDEKKQNDNDDYCVVVIGTTKVGKSSLINLFSGDSVHTSNSIKSCTKHCTIFTDKGDKWRKWMDTQGTDDDEMKDDDECVLKKAFKELYDKHVSNIKLIWIISGDMDGERGEFKKQAKFLNSFISDEKQKFKIWESCLIIHKKGQIQPKVQDIKGALAASSDFGSKIDFSSVSNQKKYLFGYTCLDWINTEDRILKLIRKLSSNLQGTELKVNGYLTGDQIRNYVNDKLNNLPQLKLEFLSQKCSKCGSKGDCRFIAAKCHTESIQKHTKMTINHHPSGTHWIHPSGKYQQSSVSYNYRTERYHSGTWTSKHGGRVASGIFSFGLSELLIDADHEWAHWTCCDGETKGGGCCTRNTSEPYTTYTTLYRCCDKSPGSNGCTEVYLCCNNKIGSIGCERIYECCLKRLDTDGCTAACKLCSVEWGKGPGCHDTNFMNQ